MRVTKEEAKNRWKYYGLFYSSTDRVISEEYLITKETGDEDVLCFDFAADKWRSLSRSEFEKLLKERKQQGELAEIQETDALWYLENHRAFDGEGDDRAVEAFLASWKDGKEKYREEWEKRYWPAKYVQTTFYLNGKQYCITPDSIGLEKGDCWDEGFLEFLQGEIGAELKEMGATEVRHTGFLD